MKQLLVRATCVRASDSHNLSYLANDEESPSADVVLSLSKSDASISFDVGSERSRNSAVEPLIDFITARFLAVSMR